MEKREKSCSELPAPLQCKMHGGAKGRVTLLPLGTARMEGSDPFIMEVLLWNL